MTRFEMTGWNTLDWLKGIVPKGSEAKEVIKILLPIVVFWIATGSFWQTALGTVIGKSILDLIHYFLQK